MEIWKDTIYPGYQVSNLGRFRSLDRKVQKRDGSTQMYKSRVLKQGLGTSGYLGVTFSREGKNKTFLAHRLVALSFLQNPDSKKTVNHLDGDKTNNKANNLEWSTYSENHLHRSRSLGLCRGGTHHQSKLSKEDVLKIRELYEKEKDRKKLATQFNVTAATIYYVVTRRTWKHV